MAGNRINFEVNFQVNQGNLTQLQNSLNQVITTANNAKATGKLTNDLREASAVARQLSSILGSSFNKDLGTLNIEKFNAGLRQTNLSLDQIRAKLSAQGNVGAAAYSQLTSSILNTNIQLKESNKFLNDMATTMANTLKWGVASSVLNTMTNSIRDAYSYTKQLDSSLTSIRIVTGDSADEMGRFAEQANAAAKNLGSTTLDYTKSALNYYQQGLGDEAVEERTEATLKAANVTGARAEEVAENLTAVWNGFKAQIGTETDYVDKLAAVADSSASNLAELATAMSKTASVGNNVGVSMDQMNAQIATIIATTRQAPETVGNALKTIYARINDIKTGADGAEISLGNYTSKMESLGISVLDSNNNLRDTGEVFEEIGSKWNSMTREQQIYLAQTMAGQRQMNNLVALFDNWGQYSDMLNVSLEAQGTLDEKNARYLESVQAHLNTLKSTWQDLYSTLLNTDEINAGIDTVTNFVSMFDSFLESFGGGIKSISAFGTMVAFVFRDQIGQAMGNMILNQNKVKENFELMRLQAEAAQGSLIAIQESGGNTAFAKSQVAEAQINQVNNQKILDVQRGITQEQHQQLINLQAQIGDEKRKEVLAQEQLAILQKEDAMSGGRLARLEQQVGLQNGYTAALTTALQEQELIEGGEEGLITAIDAAIAQREQEVSALQAEGAELERQVQLESEIKHLQSERANAERAIAADKQLNAAQQAQQAGGALQADFNKQIQSAAVVAQAKAGTDMLLGSMTALTVGIGGAISAMRTLQNESISTKEKFTQLLMLTTMMGPILVSSITKAVQGVTAFGKAAKTIELAKQAQQALLKVNVQSEAVQEALNLARTKGIAALSAEQTALLEEAGATGLDTIAKETGTVANMTFAQSLKAVASSAAAALVPLLPYIAIAATLAGAVAAVYLEYTKYDRAAEQAAETSADLKQALSDAKDEFNAVKQSLNSYTEAKAALADLTEGTKEWKMQVMEVNQQVLALLQEYPQLAQYIKNTNGVLEITAGGVDVLMNDMIEKQNKLMAASLSASAAAQQAAIDAKTVDLSRKSGLGDGTTTYKVQGEDTTIDGGSDGRETVASLASAINNFPDAMGNIMKMSEASEEEIAATIRDQMQSNSALADTFEGLNVDDMASVIKDNSSGLYELANSMVALNGTADLIAQSLVDSIDDGYKSKQDYNELSEGDKKVVDAIIGGKVGEGGEIRKQAEKELQDQGLTSHEELKKAYLDTYGGTESQAADMNVDALREAIITDIERRILADDGGLEQAIERSNQITSALESSGSKLDTSSKTALASYLEGGGTDAFRGLSDSDLDQLLHIKPETLKTLGLTKEKITELNNALEQIKENNGSDAPAIDFDVDAQELEQLTNELQNTSKEDEVFSENLRTNAVLAQEVAESILRYKDAISDLAENYDDWYDTLENGDASEIFDELEDAYGDLLDMDGSQLSDDFKSSTENLQDMKDALEGDEEAYNRLADKASEDILANISLNDDIDYEQAAAIVDDVQNYFDNNEAWINAKVGDLVIDEGLAAQFENFANEMGLYGQEAVDAFNSAFAGQGIQAEVDEDGTPVQKDFPGWQNMRGTVQTEDVSNSIFTADGIGQTVTGTVVTGVQYVADAVKGGTEQTRSGGYGIKFKKTANGGVKHNKAKNFGSSAPKSRGGGGGGGKGGKGKKGGGKGKKVQAPKKKEQKKDPYHDVNVQLEHVNENLKKLQREEKKLTGKKYLENLQKQNEELEKQRKLYKEKSIIAEQEAKRQQKELAKVGFNFASNGDITNYFDNLATLQAQVDAAYKKANSKKRTEKDVKTYEALAQAYDDVIKKIKEYEDTLSLMSDLEEKFAEARDKQIENQIETFNVSIKVVLDTKEFKKDLEEFKKEIKRIQDSDFRNLFNFNFNQAQNDVEQAAELIKDLGTIRGEYDKINGAKNDAEVTRQQQLITQQRAVVVKARDNLDAARKRKAEADQKLADKKKAAEKKNASDADKKAYKQAQSAAKAANAALNAAQQEVQIQMAALEQLEAQHSEFMKKYEGQIYGDNGQAALEDLKKYRDQLLQIGQDLSKTLEDMIEKNIEAFHYNINLRLDVSDFMQDYREFRKEVLQKLDKDEFGKLQLYSKEQAANDRRDVEELLTHVNQIMADIDAMNNDNYNAHYFDQIDQGYEDLEEFVDKLIEKGQDLADIFDECQQNWLDTIDAAKDAFDEQSSQFERIDGILGHQQKMFTMLYGDQNYGQLAAIAQKQAENSKANLVFLKQEQDYWYEAMQGAEEGSDAWKLYKENWEDAVDATNQAIEKTADYFREQYLNTIKDLGKVMQDSFAGGNWDRRQSIWEDYKRDDERYLDTLSRATKTFNLVEKAQNAIGSANAKNQKELNKWLSKTQDYLTNQTRLRQIDVDLAEKELDVLLKKQALEDAQNNKTKMRLRRDSQGNYRYQFVADQNAIDKAQQELRDSIEELRLLAKGQLKDTTDDMYNLMAEMNEQVAQAAEQYGANSVEFQDALNFIVQSYKKRFQDVGDDINEMAYKYGEYLGAEATELSLQLGEQFQNIAGLGTDAYQQLQDIFSPDGQAVSLLESFTSTVHYDAIKNMPIEIADAFNAATDLLPTATSDLVEQTGDIAKKLAETFVENAKTTQQQYANDITDIAQESEQQFEDMSKAIDKTIESTKQFIQENQKLISTHDQNIRNAKELADWSKEQLEYYNTTVKPSLDNAVRQLTDEGRYKTELDQAEFYNEALTSMVQLQNSLDSISQTLSELASYDTGGYTGDGKGGKLAVLHPREYVLTEQDTPNILTAAKIASGMMQQIQSFKDGMIPTAGSVLSSTLAEAMGMSASNEQNIIINADFSGVESAIEIKKAFNEIVNLASQKASGNRRTY